MPLDGGYCNALLLAHRSVLQQLNHVSSVQLRRSVRVLTCQLKAAYLLISLLPNVVAHLPREQ